jgi:hypothetical protein
MEAKEQGRSRPPDPPASGGAAAATWADVPRAGAPLRATAALFLATCFGAPLAQFAYETVRDQPLQALDYLDFAHGPRGAPLGAWAKELGAALIDDGRLRRFETDLHDVSFVTKVALPPWQWLLTRAFGHGNEKAITGRDGWLFFADDLRSAWGPGYLEPGVGGQEALVAIDDFRDQLAARGIELLLVPSYSKELIDAHRLSRHADGFTAAANPDLERFYEELAARGHHFVRMDELFAARRAELGDPRATLALPRDTHWTPSTMTWCAGRIAARVREMLLEDEPRAPRFAVRPSPLAGQGDLLRMLSLPESQGIYPPMELALEVVVDGNGETVRPDPASDLLLLGDSLTLVFSDPSLALGAGAGLPEHLALHLDRPLDVIAKPGGSATQVREALARRPGDGLAGKRLVIWQFGVRMLASGPDEWKKVPLPTEGAVAAAGDPDSDSGSGSGSSTPEPPRLGQPIGTKGFTTDQLRSPDYAPPASIPRDRVRLVGEIELAASIPGDFAYGFTLMIHEMKVVRVLDGTLPKKLNGDRAWIAFPGRVEGEDLPPSRFGEGMRLEMVVEDWQLRFDEQVSYQPHPDSDLGRNPVLYALTWNEVGD